VEVADGVGAAEGIGVAAAGGEGDGSGVGLAGGVEGGVGVAVGEGVEAAGGPVGAAARGPDDWDSQPPAVTARNSTAVMRTTA
jgi:hypothetical protein